MGQRAIRSWISRHSYPSAGQIVKNKKLDHRDIGLSAKGGTFSAQGTPERFGMIGMDVRLGNGTSGLRMFLPWTLICGSLSPFFMRLCTFIFNPDVHPSFECLLGSPWFSIVYKFITYLKEQIPIAPFTIGKDAQIMSLSRNLVQCLDRLLKESSILLATISLPNESTGSVHKQDGPPA